MNLSQHPFLKLIFGESPRPSVQTKPPACIGCAAADKKIRNGCLITVGPICRTLYAKHADRVL